MTRQNTIRCWPVRLPGSDGKDNSYWSTAHVAADIAVREWVQVGSNQAEKTYEVSRAKVSFPEPIWPAKTIQELMKLTFNKWMIADPNHIVLRKLRGEE